MAKFNWFRKVMKQPLSTVRKTGFGGTATGVEITIRVYQKPDPYGWCWSRMTEAESMNVLDGLADSTYSAIQKALRNDVQVGPREFATYYEERA